MQCIASRRTMNYCEQELLKAKRAGSDGYMGTSSATSASTPTNIQNNKRYLILTYAAEYDRVHYPLPLAFVERLVSKRQRSSRSKRACSITKPALTAHTPPNTSTPMTWDFDFLVFHHKVHDFNITR